MNRELSRCYSTVEEMAKEAGACAWGVCAAEELPQEVDERLHNWLVRGFHGGMGYLERQYPLRKSLDNVLSGCKSVFSFLFPYCWDVEFKPNCYRWSRHALGDDYHDVLRARLALLSKYISEQGGGKTRVCVDSAPVAERYWAVRCGLGKIGRNGLLYSSEYGSWVFIAEILSTVKWPQKINGASQWKHELCGECSLCVDSCPGRALTGDGTVNAALCRAYQTIECRDDQLPDDVKVGSRIYGCDICQEVCPINRDAKSDGTVFAPNSELLRLSRETLSAMDVEDFDRLFSNSSARRITLKQLKRNAGLS